MNNYFTELVYNWNKVANTQANDLSRKTHVKMFAEELVEYLLAVNNNDTVEQLDGACDMIVVAHGAEYVGCPSSWAMLNMAYDSFLTVSADVNTDVANEAFIEVMRSNFSKFCKTEEDAARTIEKYWLDNSVLAHYEESHGYFVARSLEDQIGKDGKEYPEGKILKGVGYFKPNLIRILESTNV